MMFEMIRGKGKEIVLLKHGLVFFDLIFFPFILRVLIKICNNTHFPFPLMQKSIVQLDASLEGYYIKLLLSWPIFFHVVQKWFDLWELHNEKKRSLYTHQTEYDWSCYDIHNKVKSQYSSWLQKEVLTTLET